tara:strand:+ start:256 stop:933 length:678 start_codon:yes stop_codon:yes gene_type:complete
MKNFNPVWDQIFSQRSPSFYPFDNVVSFVFRNFPTNKPKNQINILEVGCGGGNNLLFAAREGFNVYGIDGSKKALQFAHNRFQSAGLKGNFILGDFTKLPYDSGFFDIVIDRCSIACVNKESAIKTFKQIHRVLGPKGKFFFNSYSDLHTSCVMGKQLSNGITSEITQGSLVGNGDLSFYSQNELLDYFSDFWNIKEMKLKKIEEVFSDKNDLHAEWEIILEKHG